MSVILFYHATYCVIFALGLKVTDDFFFDDLRLDTNTKPSKSLTNIIVTLATLNLFIMNPAHIHLLTNHFPIIGTFIGLVLVIYALFINKNTSNLKAGLVIVAISCFSILPVYFSGEGAEELVEHIPGISHDKIKAHEEIAEIGLFVSLFIGLLSAITFLSVKRNNSQAKLLSYLTVVGGVVLCSLFAVIANKGGEIKHNEIELKVDKNAHTHDSDGD